VLWYKINACGLLENFMPLRSLERYAMVCMTRERTRSCGTSSLYPNRVLRARSKCVLHRRRGTTMVVTLPPVNAITGSGDRVGSQSLRTTNGATWFEYRRYSLYGTGSRRGIRDSYSPTRTVSAMGSRARHFPSRSCGSFAPFRNHRCRIDGILSRTSRSRYARSG